MSYLYINLIKTGAAILVVILIDLFIEHFAARRIHNRKKRKKTRVVFRNLLIISLIIFLAKIWIDGFGHFLAFIGFISAALTITQKENVLNLTGGFIIMWRDAFSEGDYVHIKEYKGIVDNLGIFYFTLDEVNEGHITYRTGKRIKVPNAYVSLYPFSIITVDNFIKIEKEYSFQFASNVDKLRNFSKTLKAELVNLEDQFSKELTTELKKERGRLLTKSKYQTLNTDILIQQDDHHKGYILCITGHIPAEKEHYMESLIVNKIMDFTKDGDVFLEG